MKNIVLKIQEGELFRFFDSEERESFTLGAKRTADVAIKNAALQPVQLRFEYSGGAGAVYRGIGPGTEAAVLLIKTDEGWSVMNWAEIGG